tara:strand:+ start:609 stop:1697 length:1089 start_codon:yes stop_codon:yes gene_type:complete
VVLKGLSGSEIGKVASGACSGEYLMTKAVQKTTMCPSLGIPFDKLMLSQSNVPRIKARGTVEELTRDIARRGLLQSLSVRPELGTDGTETGKFEIPAGGCRFKALSLLVKQKRLAKTTLISCIVRNAESAILAEDDSLEENMQPVPLHPLEQFRAFMSVLEKGQSDAEIAAAFFVTPQIVKQRLKLASVTPALPEVYAEDDMTLERLMAVTVNPDHARQVQVWDVIHSSWNKAPFQIRRMLALLAHCLSFSVNALYEKVSPYGAGIYAGGLTRRMAHSDLVARATGPDMVEAGWEPTVDTYLNRGPWARILEVVREAKGEGTAQLLDHLKKGEMASEAERLLKGRGWLPVVLRRNDLVALDG